MNVRPSRSALRWSLAAALALAAGGRANHDPYDDYEPAVAAAKKAVAAGRTSRTKAVGFELGRRTFAEQPEGGAVLVGFELSVGGAGDGAIIHAVRPLFVADRGDHLGEQHGRGDLRIGRMPLRLVTVKARPGYAVAAVELRAGLRLDALALRFARVRGGALDLADTYTSDWVGGAGGSPGRLDTQGALAVGVHGCADERYCTALGLILLGEARPAKADANKARPAQRRRPPPPPRDELPVLPEPVLPQLPVVPAPAPVAPAPVAPAPAVPAVQPPAEPESETNWAPYAVCGAVTLTIFGALSLTQLGQRPAPAKERDGEPPLVTVAPERVGFLMRLAALLIDVVVSGVAAALLTPLVHALDIGVPPANAAQLRTLPPQAAQAMGELLRYAAAYGVAMTIVSFAMIAWEVLTGGTPGKLLLGLRVGAADGSPALGDHLFKRAAIKHSGQIISSLGLMLSPGDITHALLSGILSMGALVVSLVVLAGCFRALGADRQALHDCWAGTAVFPRR